MPTDQSLAPRSPARSQRGAQLSIGHSAALARFSKADAASARVFDHNGWKRVTRRAGQDHCRKKSANPERPITSGKSAFR
jgi:hypothetical protein